MDKFTFSKAKKDAPLYVRSALYAGILGAALVGAFKLASAHDKVLIRDQAAARISGSLIQPSDLVPNQPR